VLWIRSTVFLVGMVLSAILFSPIAIFSGLLPALVCTRVISLWALFINFWLRVTCKIVYKVRGELDWGNGPAVILSKHQSAWETIAFQLIFPTQTWALKREVLWIPFFGWGLAATRPIAINRRAKVRALDQLIEQGTQRLQEGRWVVIFPEGTRMAPGLRGHYSPGGAMLAINCNVPIIPVAHNAGSFWGRRQFLKRPGTIQVWVGPAINTTDRKPRALIKEAEDWIEEKMKVLN